MSKLKKHPHLNLKIALEPPIGFSNGRLMPSIVRKNEIVEVKTSNPLYEPWFNAWMSSVKTDYGKVRKLSTSKGGSAKLLLKNYYYIPEIELFVINRKNSIERGIHQTSSGHKIDLMLLGILSDTLRLAFSLFQTKYLLGFAEAFEIAVHREDDSSYFDQDHFKCFRSWVRLTFGNRLTDGDEARLLDLSREEFDSVCIEWIPSSRDIIDDRHINEGDSPFAGKDGYSRNDRVKKILNELGLPYRGKRN